MLGIETLIAGSFERAEMEALRRACTPGTVAVDVGANVGGFSVALASVAGVAVWAYEPLPENASRIHENVALNRLSNVRVVDAAVVDSEGELAFQVALDPAYGSVGKVTMPGHATDRSVMVRAVTLDGEWERAGRPAVSVVKVDAEGAELEVLRGAKQLLRSERPTLLLEAPSTDQLAELERFLASFVYVRQPEPGFATYNHLFRSLPGPD